MSNTVIGIVAAISFTVGVGVGVGGVYAAPFIGLRAAEKRATEAEGAASAQATARAQENSDRTEEREDASEDVTGERLSCDARIANLTALWSVSPRPATQHTRNEESPHESCSCAEYGDIRPLDDWLRDAGLLDDG